MLAHLAFHICLVFNNNAWMKSSAQILPIFKAFPKTRSVTILKC